jgi:DNA-binding transcriptional MerR regulator
LLYYEKLGLVRPLRQGSSRYRHFRPKDLQTLLAIARWRAAGVPLASVR